MTIDKDNELKAYVRGKHAMALTQLHAAITHSRMEAEKTLKVLNKHLAEINGYERALAERRTSTSQRRIEV